MSTRSSPPPGTKPPLLWGDDAHVRELFGDRLASLGLHRKWLVERSAGGPRECCDFYRETFGPAVAAHASNPAVDADFLAFATRRNRGAATGPSEYHYGYLLVVATKR